MTTRTARRGVFCTLSKRHDEKSRAGILLLLLLQAFSVAAATRTEQPAYDLHPALQMSLFAKEPDIVDPVALTWDEEGRIYVVEMRDYPYGFGSDRKPGGTVRLLEDLNGDGAFDRSTLFADKLGFPTSVVPWKGGILVAAPPEIVFLKDNDADGKADVREVVLQGFTLGVTDSNMNGLRWGLDNRVHGLNGGNGGSITSPRKPGSALSIRGVDFSFDPGSGDVTSTFHTSGGFGLVFDEWGRRFVTYNINHIQQQIIAVRYLQRFPGLPPIEAVISISDHGDMARIYPVSEPETRVNHPEQAGHFSSAGGLGYIGSRLYPGDLFGSILVCDVVGNLVHRDVLSESGPSFFASRSRNEPEREFFASRDLAFRPVGIEMGPDGALYLIDMQRDVIEHPDYIPEKVLKKMDIRAGEDRGRIYRVTPKAGVAPRKPNLRKASSAELVDHLADPNPWWRYTAQRLLVERQDKSAVPHLQKLTRSREPMARLHALWTLCGLGALEESNVLDALSDSEPGMRENALLLAESLLPGSERLRERIAGIATDRHARVRFQAALTVGEFDHQGSAALLRILLRDYASRWSRLAVLSSLRDSEVHLLQSLFQERNFLRDAAPAKLSVLRELCDLIGARSATRGIADLAKTLTTLNEHSLDSAWQIAALEGLHSGLSRAGGAVTSTPAITNALEKLGHKASPSLFAAVWKVSRALHVPESEAQRKALSEAARRLADPSRSIERRIEDIQILALGNFSSVGSNLIALLSAAELSRLQRAALETLATFDDVDVAKGIVQQWRGLAPVVRPLAINILLRRVSFHDVLLTAIETGALQLGELTLDLEQRRRLLRESTPDIRARAAKWMGDEEYSNRKSVFEEWMQKLPERGDASRGRPVFEKLCAQCHAAGNSGFQVGPDINSLKHRSVEDLLSNILDPNMAINPAYTAYTLETVGGEIQTGILASESTDSITILPAMGKKVIVLRREIKRLESSGLSLMPEGLEAGMAPGELRDLIAFIQEGAAN